MKKIISSIFFLLLFSTSLQAQPIIAGNLTKANYKPEIKTFPIAHLTTMRPFTSVNVQCQPTQQHTVIVNRIKVHFQGQWLDFGGGRRLNPGANIFSVKIPVGADQLLIAFDHGQGSIVTVFLN